MILNVNGDISGVTGNDEHAVQAAFWDAFIGLMEAKGWRFNGVTQTRQEIVFEDEAPRAPGELYEQRLVDPGSR